MVMIEMREAAKERAFDIIEELHELGHEKKMALCELEDTLYDCFEESKEGEHSEEGTDLGFKSKYNRHYAMRNFDDDDERNDDMRHMYRRRAIRMRRYRMGRFA
jgi:hypothetical protein